MSQTESKEIIGSNRTRTRVKQIQTESNRVNQSQESKRVKSQTEANQVKLSHTESHLVTFGHI